VDDSTWSGAAVVSGKFNFGKDDVRLMLQYGTLGRYVALNFSNDAAVTANGDLDTVDGFAGFVAYRHVWTPKLRSTVSYAMQSYDIDDSLTLATNTYSPNQSSWSAFANIFYSPLPKLDIGAEYRYAVRELENGTDGDLSRLELTTKYSF
jgi:hypothetical protein